jgi:amino acid permease
MKQRIIAVGMVFIIAAIYIKQWYPMIPQFADATMADHFRHPVVLLCFVGYFLCKTDKQKGDTVAK